MDVVWRMVPNPRPSPAPNPNQQGFTPVVNGGSPGSQETCLGCSSGQVAWQERAARAPTAVRTVESARLLLTCWLRSYTPVSRCHTNMLFPLPPGTMYYTIGTHYGSPLMPITASLHVYEFTDYTIIGHRIALDHCSHYSTSLGFSTHAPSYELEHPSRCIEYHRCYLRQCRNVRTP